jgi:hypothetical protein
MARYNTVSPSGSTSTATTISTPSQGLLTEFTGTAPYTVVIPDPTLYYGTTNSFYNATSGAITLQTPAGVFRGPSSSNGSTQVIPAGTTISLASDGVNYIIVNENGGPLVATTVTVSDVAQFNGSYVRASSAFTPSNAYDLTTLTYVQTNYGQTWSVQGSSFTAVAGGRYFCSGGTTATLPSSPNLGDMVHMIDYNGNFASSNFTVNPGSNKIMRQATTMTVSTNGAAFTLIWSGSTNGWLMANGI